MPPLELAQDGDLGIYRAGDEAVLLAQAEALVRSYCGWHISPSREETVTLYGSLNAVFLPSAHVTAVSAVTDGGTAVATDAYSVRGSYLQRESGYWPKRTPVTVTFTHGYDTVPADVHQVILDVANRAMDTVKSANLTRKRVGDVDRVFATDGGEPATVWLTEANKDALGPYRILVLA